MQDTKIVGFFVSLVIFRARTAMRKSGLDVEIVGRHVLRTLSLVWEADRKMWCWNVVLQVLQAVFPIGALYFIKVLIERVAYGNHAYGEVLMAIGGFLGMQFGATVAAQYAGYVSTVLQQKLTDFLAFKVVGKAIQVDYEYYENPTYHDTLHLAQQQSLYKASIILSGLNAALLNGFSLIFLVLFFVSIHSVYAFIFVAFLLPLAFIKWYYGIAGQKQERQLAPQEREAAYLHQILTGVHFAKEARVFGFGPFYSKRFEGIRSFIRKEKQRLNRKLTGYMIVAEVIEIVAMVVIFLYLSRAAWEKTLSVGALAIYIQGFQRLQGNAKSFLQSMVQILQQKVFLQDLFLFLDMPVKSIGQGKASFPGEGEGLSVEHVSFTYPSTEKEVLHDLSLRCRRGEVIAIVGENGSGKSTLVKLLARLYDLEYGRVTVDGRQLEELSEPEFRRNTVFLFQDFEKYLFTVEENVILGAPVEGKKEEDLREALRMAGAADFVGKLSKGIQTRMGRIFEGSEQLSGGQWQKLALARIFYKEAQMIVLDEPTSAIDAMAELQIFREIKNRLKDRMVILITHRLYNLKIADRIYVMEQGRIAEEGSFDELIASCGAFRKMYDAQKL